MPPRTKDVFYVDNTGLLFPNFAGRESPMNRKGDRNFGLIIPSQELADQLTAAGYNVKVREAKEATDEYEARDKLIFLTCKLGYNGHTPPRVVMISCVDPNNQASCKRTPLNEDTIGLLDTAVITNVDCKIGPYDWKKGGDSGRTAYVQSLFITVELDKYDAKYGDIPMSGDGSPEFDGDAHPMDD